MNQAQKLQNQIKLLSDRELLEGIYMMLLTVLKEVTNDSKLFGINMVADLLSEYVSKGGMRNEKGNNVA